MVLFKGHEIYSSAMSRLALGPNQLPISMGIVGPFPMSKVAR